MSNIMEIDGSYLEGGGQILRISIALSAIVGIPVRVTKIRAGRPKPGLAAQHLKGIELVAQMCDARLRGAEIGSTEVEFVPGKLKGGHFVADTRTAGSISLLLQVALPCALFAPSKVTLELKGGTNADMAPQIDYMEKVFRPTLRHFGADFSLDIIRRGYYPRGGGLVKVSISPVKQLNPVRIMDRGEVKNITGWSFVAGNLPISLAHKMTNAAQQQLKGLGAVNIHTCKEPREMAPDNCFGILMSVSSFEELLSLLSPCLQIPSYRGRIPIMPLEMLGLTIRLMGETTSGCVLGADALGKKNSDGGALGAGAAAALRAELDSGACLDENAQDQVIIYMALAAGQSSVRVGEISLHTKTAIHVAQLLTKVQFDIVPLSEQNVIQCDGCGISNKFLE